MSGAVFESIKKLLDFHKVQYTSFDHEPVRTSEDAANVRERITGIPAVEHLKRGAKAMIVRSEGKYYQFVLSAVRKLDFKKVKHLLQTESATLASPEEVQKITNCIPGSVPPFGNLFNIPVYVDPSLLANDMIDFNAGETTVSILMKKDDWILVVQPMIATFSA